MLRTKRNKQRTFLRLESATAITSTLTRRTVGRLLPPCRCRCANNRNSNITDISIKLCLLSLLSNSMRCIVKVTSRVPPRAITSCPSLKYNSMRRLCGVTHREGLYATSISKALGLGNTECRPRDWVGNVFKFLPLSTRSYLAVSVVIWMRCSVKITFYMIGSRALQWFTGPMWLSRSEVQAMITMSECESNISLILLLVRILSMHAAGISTCHTAGRGDPIVVLPTVVVSVDVHLP